MHLGLFSLMTGNYLVALQKSPEMSISRYKEFDMQTSAQIINFREPARQLPAAVVELEVVPARSDKEMKALNDLNTELEKLIQELGKYIPNYVRI